MVGLFGEGEIVSDPGTGSGDFISFDLGWSWIDLFAASFCDCSIIFCMFLFPLLDICFGFLLGGILNLGP